MKNNYEDETPSRDLKVIRLTQEQYNELERAMQWPEDLEKWEKINTPTQLTEIEI